MTITTIVKLTNDNSAIYEKCSLVEQTRPGELIKKNLVCICRYAKYIKIEMKSD